MAYIGALLRLHRYKFEQSEVRAIAVKSMTKIPKNHFSFVTKMQR